MTQELKDVITDLVSDFLYYDRKEDEDLPEGEIQSAIERGDLTVNQIAATFERELRNGLEN